MMANLSMMDFEFISTDFGRKDYRMKHFIMIFGIKIFHHQQNFGNGFMKILLSDGMSSNQNIWRNLIKTHHSKV